MTGSFLHSYLSYKEPRQYESLQFKFIADEMSLLFRYLVATSRHSRKYYLLVAVELDAKAPRSSEALDSGDIMPLKGFPFMMTNLMRSYLVDLGFSEEEIYSMPIDRAHKILHASRTWPPSEEL
jgi:hypothetical protein